MFKAAGLSDYKVQGSQAGVFFKLFWLFLGDLSWDVQHLGHLAEYDAVSGPCLDIKSCRCLDNPGTFGEVLRCKGTVAFIHERHCVSFPPSALWVYVPELQSESFAFSLVACIAH